jgi:hypothetical protein
MNTNKLLKEVFNEILKEVHTNPDLGLRLGKIVEKYASASDKLLSRPYRRKPGAFDPLVVYREDPSKLLSRLTELNLEQLKDIVAEQGMDRSKLAMKWKTKERLVDLIVTTVESRVRKGDAFRTPPLSTDSDS